MRAMSIPELLAKIWLFGGIDQEHLEKLATFAFTKEYGPGEVILQEGRTANGIYIVSWGQVEVVKGFETERAKRLAILGPGEFFGEMGLLEEQPRSATVRAIDPTCCVGIDRWLFLRQVQRDPKIAVAMLQAMARRLRETDDRFAEQE
jgi:CRP/FNR family cyclic AMP-dependent transcriptional regulator